MVFNAAISSHERVRRWRAALGLVAELPKSVASTTVSFNSLLGAMRSNGLWRGALEVFSLLQQRLLRPTGRTFTAALKASSDWHRALELLRPELKTNSTAPRSSEHHLHINKYYIYIYSDHGHRIRFVFIERSISTQCILISNVL